MRIFTLYISNSNMYGGAYKRYMELINGFLCKGWEVHHVSPTGFSNISNENFYHHGIRKIHFKPTYLLFSLQALTKLIVIGKRNKADAIVSFAIFDALIGIIFRVIYRDTKIIFCDRGDSIKGIVIDLREKHHLTFLSYILKILLGIIEKFVYNRVDFVIFNSHARKKEIDKKFKINKKKVEIIYNNANPSWVIKGAKEAIEESEKIKRKWAGKTILCYIGNLFIEGRDIKTLLKAFRRINAVISDTVLIIVGDGPDKERLIAIKNSMGLDYNVVLEGWKDNPFPYMLASDINIVTGLHEGCSNTILESIYFENIIIGSRVGGIPKLLKYEEFLFPPKNDHELAKKILNLLKNEHEFIKAKKEIKKRKEKFVFDWNEKMTNSIKKVICY